MPSRIQDIVPNNRRSVRDIETKRSSKIIKDTPRESARSTRDIPIHIKSPSKEPISDHKLTLEPHESTNGHKPKRVRRNGLRWLFITLGIIIVIAGIGYIATTYFAQATFTLVPRSITVDIDSTYIAQEKSQAENIIGYEVETIRDTASSTVLATSGAPISTKAEGPIVLFNSFSSQSQRLMAGTKLNMTDGRTYRLTSTVVIPGYTYTANKTAIVPGSTRTTIIADQPGETYNITGQSSFSDLKISAYKGTSKYETIYGRITSEITGGYLGSKVVVDPKVQASTTYALGSSLVSSLLAQARSRIDNDHIMYDNGFSITFSTSTVSSIKKDSADIIVTGTLKAFVFNKKTLTSRLVGATTTASFGSYGYTITGLDKLDTKFISISTSTKSTNKNTQYSVRIKGQLKLVGIIPVADIQKKLAGRPITDTDKIIKPYSEVVETISGELMPPWASVPTDISHISVVTKEK